MKVFPERSQFRKIDTRKLKKKKNISEDGINCLKLCPAENLRSLLYRNYFFKGKYSR